MAQNEYSEHQAPAKVLTKEKRHSLAQSRKQNRTGKKQKRLHHYQGERSRVQSPQVYSIYPQQYAIQLARTCRLKNTSSFLFLQLKRKSIKPIVTFLILPISSFCAQKKILEQISMLFQKVEELKASSRGYLMKILIHNVPQQQLSHYPHSQASPTDYHSLESFTKRS